MEDSEFARTAAVKGRQHAEQELLEAQQQLEEALRLRGEAEDKYLACNRERSNYQSQVRPSFYALVCVCVCVRVQLPVAKCGSITIYGLPLYYTPDLFYGCQVDDLEVELNEVMRKYKAAVAQLSVDQITLQDQAAQLMTLEHEKSALKEQVTNLHPHPVIRESYISIHIAC